MFQHIVHSMKDPSIAAFWMITMPQIMGGFNYDDDVKQKIWWQYKVHFLFSFQMLHFLFKMPIFFSNQLRSGAYYNFLS